MMRHLTGRQRVLLFLLGLGALLGFASALRHHHDACSWRRARREPPPAAYGAYPGDYRGAYPGDYRGPYPGEHRPPPPYPPWADGWYGSWR